MKKINFTHVVILQNVHKMEFVCLQEKNMLIGTKNVIMVNGLI